FQFIRAQAQRGALDRIDLLDAAIEERCEPRVQFRATRIHAAHQILEVFEVGDLHVLFVPELLDDRAYIAPAHLPCIQRLQRAPPRARTRGRIDAFGTCVRAHAEHSLIIAAISTAARATSSPLLPCVPPARERASASRSTASTPFNTGTR